MNENERNVSSVDNKSSDFQRRTEPNFAWGNAADILQELIALRGGWTMGPSGSGGNTVIDTSGGGYHLSRNSNPNHGLDGLVPYVNFDGSNDELYYLNNAQFNITGQELSTVGTYRGLMLGGWFWFDDDPTLADQEHLIGIWSTVLADRAYRIVRLTDGTIRFQIGNGVATPGVASTTVAVSGQWYFCAARWDPNVLEYIYVGTTNGTLEIVSGATIAAPIVTSAANFTIGAMLAGTDDRMDGRASHCWVCASQSASHTLIKSIFHHQRAMFGS